MKHLEMEGVDDCSRGEAGGERLCKELHFISFYLIGSEHLPTIIPEFGIDRALLLCKPFAMMNYSIGLLTLAAMICVAHTTAQAITPFPTQSPPLPPAAEEEEKESLMHEMEARKHNMEDILEEETVLEYEIEEELISENDITGDDMEPFLAEEEGFVNPNAKVETEKKTKEHGRKKKGKDGPPPPHNTTNTSDVDSNKKRGGHKKKHEGPPKHANSTEVDTPTKKKRLGSGHKKKHEEIEKARTVHHKMKMKKMEHETEGIGTPLYFEESDPIETPTPSNHGSKAEKEIPQPDNMDIMEPQGEEYYDAEEEKRLRRKKVTDAEAVAYMNGKARKLLSLEEEGP